MVPVDIRRAADIQVADIQAADIHEVIKTEVAFAKQADFGDALGIDDHERGFAAKFSRFGEHLREPGFQL